MTGVRREVIPFLWASAAAGGVVLLGCWTAGTGGAAALAAGTAAVAVLGAYMLYFFRDPERTPPGDPDAVLAGADGLIAGVADVREDRYLKADAVRVSIFLGLFDVHVNRAPIAGRVAFLGYFPGRRFFTFQEKSSEHNQHSKILIEGERSRCLIHQIVGPVCRRVVYWLELGRHVRKGEPIGMMKFGSRLDMYFPRQDVAVVVKRGDRVRAGESVVARMKGAADR